MLLKLQNQIYIRNLYANNQRLLIHRLRPREEDLKLDSKGNSCLKNQHKSFDNRQK